MNLSKLRQDIVKVECGVWYVILIGGAKIAERLVNLRVQEKNRAKTTIFSATT